METTGERGKRRAFRDARRNRLYALLCLQASVVCDSHRRRDVARRNETSGRMLRTLLELMGDKPMRRHTKEALVKHLKECGYVDEPDVELEEGDMLYVNGHFDVGDLAKRLAWGDQMVGETING
jgi:hypothetical protein